MSYAVTPDELIRTFGLSGVVYFPRYESAEHAFDAKTADFLSSVGLPHGDQFLSRAEGDTVSIAEHFAEESDGLPKECRSWLVLGWFQYMVIALDPDDGKVYGFGEGDPLDAYSRLHRDVESLVYTMVAFMEFQDACSDGAGLDELESRFKEKIDAFDPIPFSDEESEWVRIIDGVLEESWSA
jgi:hypothetical protein